MTSRREFCRSLLGLACVGVGGCKIEPILDLETEGLPIGLGFPELPPQIPDLLQDDESTLRALTEEFIAREAGLLRGELAVRSPEDPRAVDHLVELLRSFGVYPAGNRGDWRQPVPLDIVEPSGEQPMIAIRPESEPPAIRQRPAAPTTEPDADPNTPTPDPDAAPPDPDAAPPDPDAAPPDPDPNAAPPDPNAAPPDPNAAPPEPNAAPPDPNAAPPDPNAAPPEPDAAPSEPDAAPSEPDTPKPSEAPPSRAIDLVPLGAFRQRGPQQPAGGLLLTRVLKFRTPLPIDEVIGRVVLLRAPDDLDLTTPDSPARIDLLMSAVRDAGALGCLLLTNDEGPGIERFAARWRRQVRHVGGAEQPMLIEGLLAASARKPLEDAVRKGTWLLDLNLATINHEIMSHNVISHVIGRQYPGKTVVLICDWDTPDLSTAELDTTRLLTTLAAFFQLAEWSRRSTPPKYSLSLLLTVNAGFGAGTAAHAAWAAHFGMETKAILGLDRPTTVTTPEALLAGRYDAEIAELARRAVAADGRGLLLADRLTRPELAPYLRYPPPVMTIGAPEPDTVEQQSKGEESEVEPPVPDDPLADMRGDVHMLRNLALALATRR